MSDSGRGDRPEYKVYKSRPGGRAKAGDGLDRLRERFQGDGDDGRRPPKRPSDPRRPRDPRRPGEAPGPRRPVNAKRVAKWVGWAVVAWIALSAVLFVISAQIQKGVSSGTEDALSGGGSFVTGTNVLVLGSDSRAGESIDKTQSGPGRADSILVLHAAFGSVRKLSIPRDSLADIPGHDPQKINAAYAFGGAGLMTRTVEGFLGGGLKINHVVEVDFQDFPDLIDTLGGITVNNKSKICAPQFDNFYKGFRLDKGAQHLDGRTALGFARVRHNDCAPGENDLARAGRQQEVLSGIRGKLLSPVSFFRLPLISWQAPKTIQTDMSSPGLTGLFTDLITGNPKGSTVLRPQCLGCGPGGSLVVAQSERADAVRRLLHGD